MTGSLIQIISKGPQDDFLTGNPQISYFKSLHKKHTNFASELVENKSTQNINKSLSTNLSYDIDKYGDLIHKIYVRVKTFIKHTLITTTQFKLQSLNHIKLNITTILQNNDFIYFNQDYYYKNNNQYLKIINKNEFYKIINIDSNTYQIFNHSNINNFSELQLLYSKINSDYLPITTNIDFYKVNQSFNKDITNILKEVEVEIGNIRIDKHYYQYYDLYNQFFEDNHNYRYSLTQGINHNLLNNIPGYSECTNYIPLRFWFNKDIGMSLPLVSLQFSDIKIKLIIDPTIANDIEIKESTLLINYIFLDEDERSKFLRADHEFIIEQLQISGPESHNPISLSFNHPVKSLFWNIYDANYDSVSLLCNNHYVFDNTSDYFHLIQPYETESYNKFTFNTKNRTWTLGKFRTSDSHNSSMYSFSLRPKSSHPSGSINFSKIDDAILDFKNISKTSYSIYVFAINYNVLKIINGLAGLLYSY
tara:strand:- start:56 stop:1486 length:1431 start_codon:yes stop_codon:yes gene_type:complete